MVYFFTQNQSYFDSPSEFTIDPLYQKHISGWSYQNRMSGRIICHDDYLIKPCLMFRTNKKPANQCCRLY